METKPVEKSELDIIIEKGRKEIAEGNVETISVDELWK
jgi:hypothetical protein